MVLYVILRNFCSTIGKLIFKTLKIMVMFFVISKRRETHLCFEPTNLKAQIKIKNKLLLQKISLINSEIDLLYST